MTEAPQPTRVHPEYAAQLSHPGIRPWYDTVVALTDNPLNRPIAEANMIGFLRGKHPGLRHFPFRFEWIADPAVRNIVGRDMAVPTLALDPFHADAFMALSGRSVTGASTLTIPTEVVVGQKLDKQTVNPMKVVLLRDATEDTLATIPFEQRRRNGIVAALDPNELRRRTLEGALIDRMVSVIGELSGPEHDAGTVNVLPEYWLPVLTQMESVTPDLIQVLGLQQNQLTNEGMANALTAFISKLAEQHRNSDLVRLFMSCIDFEDLREKFPSEIKTIVIDFGDLDDGTGSN